MTERTAMERASRQLLAERASGESICPSEAARAVGREDRRQLMPATRTAVWSLAAKGRVLVLQRGEWIERQATRGPRIALADPPPEWSPSVPTCPM